MKIILPKFLYGGVFLLALSSFFLKSSAWPSRYSAPLCGPADQRNDPLFVIQQLKQLLTEREQENLYLREQVASHAAAAAHVDQHIGGLMAYRYYLENQLAAARKAYSELHESYISLQSSAAVMNPSVATIWGCSAGQGEKGNEGKPNDSLDVEERVLPEEDTKKFDLEWASGSHNGVENTE
jgi:hypothetical protein